MIALKALWVFTIRKIYTSGRDEGFHLEVDVIFPACDRYCLFDGVLRFVVLVSEGHNCSGEQFASLIRIVGH